MAGEIEKSANGGGETFKRSVCDGGLFGASGDLTKQETFARALQSLAAQKSLA